MTEPTTPEELAHAMAVDFDLPWGDDVERQAAALIAEAFGRREAPIREQLRLANIDAFNEQTRAERAEAINERHEEWIRIVTQERDKALSDLDVVATTMGNCINEHKARAEAAEKRVRELTDALQGLYEIVTDDDARGVDDTIDKWSAIAVAFDLLKEARE